MPAIFRLHAQQLGMSNYIYMSSCIGIVFLLRRSAVLHYHVTYMVNQYVWLRRSFKRARIEDSEEVHMTVHKLIEQVSVGKANLRQNQDLKTCFDLCGQYK